ncbi:Elongin-C [Orbilia brochopaga]|nr:Elongin-C [Drechslerella brochopaga]
MDDPPDDKGSLTLISNDGFQFVLPKKVAFTSKTIRNMFNKKSGYIEAKENRVRFDEMSANILEKVCEYFCYKDKYAGRKGDVPDFVIPPEMALELMTMADFLET